LLGDAPAAIDSMKRGTTLLPDEPEAHSQLGVAWLATGHADEAVRELSRGAPREPRHGTVDDRSNQGGDRPVRAPGAHRRRRSARTLGSRHGPPRDQR